jgi:8-oxo-dGTP pyrophosphatase MutT (NUDIX family)
VTDTAFDPAAVPVRPAATVLICDERPDLHVLMLKRNARSIFVGDMWVFPGGAVDPGDATPRADAAVEHLTDVAASRALGIDGGGIAYWVAALRETFEEAGVLLARPRGVDTLIDLSEPAIAARFERHRDEVNAGTGDFIDIVVAEDLLLDGADVHYVAHWITPLGSPRRYDTRFFVTAMPRGQVPLHDDDEAVHHEWVRPGRCPGGERRRRDDHAHAHDRDAGPPRVLRRHHCRGGCCGSGARRRQPRRGGPHPPGRRRPGSGGGAIGCRLPRRRRTRRVRRPALAAADLRT